VERSKARSDLNPLAFLFQLEKENLSIDEKDIIIINKLFDDISDFYKLKENISVVIKENYLNEKEIKYFFIRLLKGRPSGKNTLGEKVGSSNHWTPWKFIFELPEMIKGSLENKDLRARLRINYRDAHAHVPVGSNSQGAGVDKALD
jgi:hypothetical protein